MCSINLFHHFEIFCLLDFSKFIFFFFILFFFFKIDLSIPEFSFLIVLIPSFSYAIALFLQLLAIPKIGQTNTALFLYLEPVVAIIGAVILLKETLTKYQLVGAVIVLSSLALATYLSGKIKNDSS